MIITIDELIFFRGAGLNHQPVDSQMNFLEARYSLLQDLVTTSPVGVAAAADGSALAAGKGDAARWTVKKSGDCEGGCVFFCFFF